MTGNDTRLTIVGGNSYIPVTPVFRCPHMSISGGTISAAACGICGPMEAQAS